MSAVLADRLRPLRDMEDRLAEAFRLTHPHARIRRGGAVLAVMPVLDDDGSVYEDEDGGEFEVVINLTEIVRELLRGAS